MPIPQELFFLVGWASCPSNKFMKRTFARGLLEQELKEVRRWGNEILKSVPTVAQFPQPAALLNQLKARRKKSGANLADIETVLEILENH